MKNEIRRILREKRKLLNKDFTEGKALLFSEHLFSSEIIKKDNLMAYCAIENEADPSEIIKQCIKQGFNVYLPCMDNNFKIHPCRYSNLNRAITGKYNIPEPQNKEYIDPEKLNYILVPGVAFDRHGNRIGFGKGCYDEFLKGQKALKIGLCYDFQVLETVIEADKHDITMDYLLTENGLTEVKNAL